MQTLCVFKSSVFLAWMHIYLYANVHVILGNSSFYIATEVWFGHLKIITCFSVTDFIYFIPVAKVWVTDLNGQYETYCNF